jgi:hypothetical protein
MIGTNPYFRNNMQKVEGYEFYNSDEFKALCRRFDIPHERLTTDMKIEIPCIGCVEITQKYMLGKKDNFDTTTIQNESYITHQPNTNPDTQ